MRPSPTSIKLKRVRPKPDQRGDPQKWSAADLTPTAKLRPFSETARFDVKVPDNGRRAKSSAESKSARVGWRVATTNKISRRTAIILALICAALLLAGFILWGHWRRTAAPLENPALRYPADADP